MIRKIITIFVILVMGISNYILCYEIESDEININSIPVSSNLINIPITNSKSILVLERTTQTVLLEKSGYKKIPMASTTKIMTAILAIENCDLKTEVLISPKAASTGGSTLGIKSNSKLSMNTLLYGLLMRSGNDCAVAIAEHISGSVSNFAKLMNKKAILLKLSNTNYITPHGLDSDNHYTTAYDLAILTNYALNNPVFAKIVNTKTATINIAGYLKTINNTHELLGYLDGVYGVKTGFTGNAGRCLVTACKRNNLDIIIVVLGADTKNDRTKDTVNIINYIYNNYEMINTENFIVNNFKIKQIDIKKSFKKADIYLEKKSNYIYPIFKNTKNYKIKIYFFKNLTAPLKVNTKIGTIKLYSNNQLLYENNILIRKDIKSISITEYFIYLIKNIKHLTS